MQVIAIPRTFISGDYEKVAFTTGAVVTLTAAKLKNSAGKPVQAVFLSVETKSVRWMDHGGTPTTGAAGNGSPLAAGAQMLLHGYHSAKNLKFIGLDGDGVMHVQYYY